MSQCQTQSVSVATVLVTVTGCASPVTHCQSNESISLRSASPLLQSVSMTHSHSHSDAVSHMFKLQSVRAGSNGIDIEAS